MYPTEIIHKGRRVFSAGVAKYWLGGSDPGVEGDEDRAEDEETGEGLVAQSGGHRVDDDILLGQDEILYLMVNCQ